MFFRFVFTSSNVIHRGRDVQGFMPARLNDQIKKRLLLG